MLKLMIMAAAYVRVSKEEQAEKDLSIPAQKSKILAYCQSQGWEIYDSYVDDGYSAKDLNRPDMQRLLKDCADRKFNVVVVVRLDRISRSQKDVLFLIEDVFEPNAIGFKSVTQTFDTTSAFGKAAIGMVAVFAQLERDQLIERVSDAKKEAARQGRFMGGPPPFGYIYNPTAKSLNINEIESEVIRLVYSEYLRGETGYQAIADNLNQRRIPAKKANAWSRSTVHKLLTNPFYAGYIAHKGSFYKGQHQAIVTVDEFNQVQDLLKTRSGFLPQVSLGLVSGLIFCGECGARMRTKNVWQNYPHTEPKKITRYYICYSQDGSTPYMVKDSSCRCGYKQAANVDGFVVNRLMQYAANPKLVKEVAKELLDKAHNQAISRVVVQTKRELDSIIKKLSRWYDVFEKGALAPDELTDRVKDLREQRGYLEQQLLLYESAETKKQEQVRSVEDYIDTLRNFKRVWQEATEEERKGVIRNLVKKVRVYKDDRVELEFFPD
jgi:site-specific DNA recombinase